MDVKPGNIDVHINELVLDGFQNVDQSLLKAAIQRERSRLVAHGSLPAPWNKDAKAPSLDGGMVNLSPTAGADSIGTHIAQALNRGLTQ